VSGIDWRGFPQPKTGDTPKKSRARRRRGILDAAAVDKARVMRRHGGRCVAWGISRVCQQWAVDPHELIPVGVGGPRESWNRVPICRACHRAAQGTVGGTRLKFWWPGKEDGTMPAADTPGHVRCYWAEGKNPDDYPNPFTTKTPTNQQPASPAAIHLPPASGTTGQARQSPGLHRPAAGPVPGSVNLGLPLD